MNKKLKRLAAIGGAAVMGGALLTVQGTSNAESVAGFRLSQFGGFVANICVQTDLDRACTGNQPIRHSSVHNVRFNNPLSHQCEVSILAGPALTRRLIDRTQFKECKLVGIIDSARIVLVRPDGSEA